MPLPAITPTIRLPLASGLAAICLCAPVLAETTTLTDIEVHNPIGFTLTIPAVEVDGSSLDEAALRALLSGDPATPWSGLDASRIAIPELTFVMKAPGAATPQTTVYRDIEVLDIEDGVAASATVGSVETADAAVGISFGRMSAGRLDIGAMTDLYTLRGRPGDTRVRPVYADFLVDGGQLTAPGAGCEFGAVRLAEFSARPLQTSFEDILPLLEQLAADPQAEGGPDPEAITRVVHFYVDMFTAFRSAPIELDGFSCSGSNPEGDPVVIASGPVTAGGFAPGIYPAISVSDLRLDVEKQGWLEFAGITLKAMDFNGAIAALKAAARLDEAWFAANWRKLVPAFDGFAISGFRIDVPDPESPGRRIEARIGAVDVTLADYVNGIPASIRLNGSDIQLALPPGEPALAGLGYDRVDLDYDIALRWDEAARSIVVDRFTVADAALGSVRVSGTLGNATAGLFSDDPDTAAAAAAALTLKDLEVEIADAGMSELLIALAAREQNQRPVVLRAMLSGLAQALPVATLGATPESLALGAELRAFIDGKPNLTLTVTATDPAGIGLAELQAAQQDPSTLGGRITIAAKASGERQAQPGPAAPAEPDPDDSAAPADKFGPPIRERQRVKATMGM